MASEEEIGLPDLGEHMDGATFEQILEMDDEEDDREFSRSIVFGFFEQAENTFNEMEDNLEKGNLEVLSTLGHFLKGSSATLGLNYMKQSCEKIQHFGKGFDETGSVEMDSDDCLRNIRNEFMKLKTEYKLCERKLRQFYA